MSGASYGPQKVDSETRNNALSEWSKRKKFEKTLKNMLVQQALQNIEQDAHQ
jgi:hypothetical protein